MNFHTSCFKGLTLMVGKLWLVVQCITVVDYTTAPQAPMGAPCRKGLRWKSVCQGTHCWGGLHTDQMTCELSSPPWQAGSKRLSNACSFTAVKWQRWASHPLPWASRWAPHLHSWVSISACRTYGRSHWAHTGFCTATQRLRWSGLWDCEKAYV